MKIKLIGHAGAVIVVSLLLLAAAAHAQAPSSSYRIGAWYFPIWRADVEGIQVKQSEKIYGRKDVWGGVRDYAEGHSMFPILNPNGLPISYRSRKPQLGFYDLRSDDIIKAHIGQARQGGLSFFAFYWYWDSDLEAEKYDTAVRFLNNDPTGSLNYVLAGISLGTKRITMTEWQSKIVPSLVIKYFAHPAYLRIDGRPVFVDFNLNFDTLETSQTAYDVLRKYTKAQLGVEPFLIKRVGLGTVPQNLNHYFSAQKMDGLTCFRFGPTIPYEGFAMTTRKWHANLDYWIAMSATRPANQSTFIPCGTTGFDSRPWYMIGWGPWVDPAFTAPDQRPFNPSASALALRSHFSYVKATLDRYPDVTRSMAILYAWNEWGEGGTIEPNAINGDATLRLVRDVFYPLGLPQKAAPAPAMAK